LYCDEDSVQHALVVALRKRGVDIQSALHAGMLGESDDRQLAYAAAQGRAIYSFNVGDFCRLHSQWRAEQRSHPGIIVARQQQYSIGEQVRRLVRLVGALSAAEMRNRLEFLRGLGRTRRDIWSRQTALGRRLVSRVQPLELQGAGGKGRRPESRRGSSPA
jgi:hypothetical protein